MSTSLYRLFDQFVIDPIPPDIPFIPGSGPISISMRQPLDPLALFKELRSLHLTPQQEADVTAVEKQTKERLGITVKEEEVKE